MIGRVSVLVDPLRLNNERVARIFKVNKNGGQDLAAVFFIELFRAPAKKSRFADVRGSRIWPEPLPRERIGPNFLLDNPPDVVCRPVDSAPGHVDRRRYKLGLPRRH